MEHDLRKWIRIVEDDVVPFPTQPNPIGKRVAPMTVFILFHNGFHDIPEFIGVFSTREKAENCIKGFVKPHSGFEIDEHEVDER